jgi:four helix bundle protein
MFLQLAHTRLDVFEVSKAFVLACYKETKSFPSEEKFGIISQIRRAALSVHLNIAEGCSRKSIAERKRFYEIARGSIIEVDAALDIAVRLGYTSKEKLTEPGNLMIKSFQMISKMISQ